MIKYIPYRYIDRIKYDDCIRRSASRRVYAFSWYLDCVTFGWDVLVEDDYKLVMPLPRNRKFGIPYIFTPSWVQQLGVFSLDEISEHKIAAFIRSIPKKFFWIDYQFNADNHFELSGKRVKLNYLLPLERTYKEIIEGFNNNRKRILRNDFSNLVLDKEGKAAVFFENYRALEKPYATTAIMMERLYNLCQGDHEQVHVWNVFHTGVFAGGLIWLHDTNRITYLVPVSTDIGRQFHVSTFLIDQLIRQFQGGDIVLDFEGSMVQGVQKFYQSFGAVPESYNTINKRLFWYV